MFYTKLMYSFLSLTEFEKAREVKREKKGLPKGYRVMSVAKHKTGIKKNASIIMSPTEYKITRCYVQHYRILMLKRKCSEEKCPLFQASFKAKNKQKGHVSECCQKFGIENVYKVIIFLSRIDTLVEIVKLFSSF